MKIPQKKSHKLLLFSVGLAIIVLLAGGFYWWLKHRSTTASTNATKPATSQERQDSATAKQNDINAPSNTTTGGTGTSTVPGTGSGSGSQQIPLAITITRAGQVGGAGQPISVRTLVNGTTSGTCTMIFSQAGQANITKTYNITFQATSSTCNADIPASDFPTGGAWSLSATATSGSSTSAAATWNLTVTK